MVSQDKDGPSASSGNYEHDDGHDDDERGHEQPHVERFISDEYIRILSTTDVDPAPQEHENYSQPGGPCGTLAEDLLRSQSSRETGFVGSMSEIHWLRIFLNQTQPARLGTIASVRRTSPQYTESCSYYLDDMPVELEMFIDPHELPDASTARKLFSCYSIYVHKTFPILPTNFEEQFEKWCRSMEIGNTIRTPNTWLALLNLVFAIGAAFSHQINAEWQGDEDDHKVYLSRASQLLGIKDTILFLSAPDGPLIQV